MISMYESLQTWKRSILQKNVFRKKLRIFLVESREYRFKVLCVAF